MSKQKLSEIVDFNPSRRIGRASNAPFVDMAALPANSRDISEIGEREFNGSGSKFCDGDTLFARITPCLENGKTAKVSGLGEGVVGHGSTEFIVMAAKDPAHDEDYVYYMARHPEFRAFAKARMEGTSGRQRVAWQSLADYEFDFPEKEQRKEIGKVLSDLDDKIELNRQINQTLEQIAQAIFKSWFGDFEPVKAKIEAKAAGQDPERAAMCAISGKAEPELDQLSPENYQQLAATAALFPDELVESELGLIPEGWEVGPISMFGEVTIGGDWGKDSPENEGFIQAIPLRGVDLEHLRSTGEALKAPVRWVKKTSIEKRTPNECDVLIGGSGAGPCGRPLWFSEKIPALFDAPLVYSNFVKRIRCREKNHAIFLDFVLWEMFNGGEIQNFINGTSVPNLNDKGLMARLTVLPHTKVLSAFYVAAMGWYMNLYSGQSRTLATLRDALLPKLLSGEINLDQAQSAMESTV